MILPDFLVALITFLSVFVLNASSASEITLDFVPLTTPFAISLALATPFKPSFSIVFNDFLTSFE